MAARDPLIAGLLSREVKTREQVKQLLTDGANIEARDDLMRTPLIIASQDNELEVVKELLAQGADVNAENSQRWTALYVPTLVGKRFTEVIKELVAHGATITPQILEHANIEVKQLLLRGRKNVKKLRPSAFAHETAYFIMGHGLEDPFMRIVPKGCTLVVQVHSGETNYISADTYSNIFNYKDKHKFLDPVTYYKDVVDIINKGRTFPIATNKSVAIYTEGDQYPDFTYSLVNAHVDLEDRDCKLKESGIAKYPFGTTKFKSNMHNLNTPNFTDEFLSYFERSVYPTREELARHMPPGEPTLEDILNSLNVGFSGYYTRASQSEIFKKLGKGVYYNIVCRGTRTNILTQHELPNAVPVGEPRLMSRSYIKPELRQLVHNVNAAAPKQLSLENHKEVVNAIGEAAAFRAPHIEALKLNRAQPSRTNVREIIDNSHKSNEQKTKTLAMLIKMGMPVSDLLISIMTSEISALEAEAIKTQLIKNILKLDTISAEDMQGKGEFAQVETTPLLKAIALKYTDIAKELIAKGALVNIETGTGFTPLIFATLLGNSEVVRELLLKNAEVNVFAVDGKTSLIHASSRGYTDIIDMLLKKGADVNIIDKQGKTALLHALIQGNLDSVARLLKEDPVITPQISTFLSEHPNANSSKLISSRQGGGAKRGSRRTRRRRRRNKKNIET